MLVNMDKEVVVFVLTTFFNHLLSSVKSKFCNRESFLVFFSIYLILNLNRSMYLLMLLLLVYLYFENNWSSEVSMQSNQKKTEAPTCVLLGSWSRPILYLVVCNINNLYSKTIEDLWDRKGICNASVSLSLFTSTVGFILFKTFSCQSLSQFPSLFCVCGFFCAPENVCSTWNSLKF